MKVKGGGDGNMKCWLCSRQKCNAILASVGCEVELLKIGLGGLNLNWQNNQGSFGIPLVSKVC